MTTKSSQSLAVRCLWLGLVVLPGSLISMPLKAQTIDSAQLPDSDFLPQPRLPRDTQPPSPEPPQPLPPPEDLLPPPTETPTPQTPPNNVPQTITVERFEVVGSTVFSQEQLAEVLAPFTQKRLSFAELLQARSAITQLYIEQGYITSGAYLPPQRLEGGVVRIRVVEGQLQDIQVTGIQHLSPDYVRSRIAVNTSSPLNRERLLEALQLLQLNPLIENLSAELSAGSSPGASVLEVRVAEADSFNVQLVTDNLRSPSVGSFRRGFQLSEASILKPGDSLSFEYANTDGSNAIDASYALPLNPRDGTLSFNYGTTLSNVIEPPFDTLDIESDFRYYELTLRQPLIQTPEQEFALGLTASRRENDISSSLLESEGFPLSELSSGASEEGRTRISALRFFQEWTQRNRREVIAVRSQFSLGVGWLNATVNENPEPDSRFFAWRGQAQWVRLLARDTSLLLRTNVQLSSTALVPIEQFGLGGLESVRGYRQNLLLTDNGAFASAEVRLPIVRVSQAGVLQIAPFVDVGTTWNNSGRDAPEQNTLASIGLGLRFSSGDRFTARLDWGIPLVSVDSRDRTWQENGLYFSVRYNPS